MSNIDSTCIRITFSVEEEIEMGRWKHFENEGKNFFFSVFAVYYTGHFLAVYYSSLLIPFWTLINSWRANHYVFDESGSLHALVQSKTHCPKILEVWGWKISVGIETPTQFNLKNSGLLHAPNLLECSKVKEYPACSKTRKCTKISFKM
jgi:hypothetical protein